MFVHERPDNGERIEERSPEINRREGEAHIQFAPLNIASDRCDNALGYGTRTHIPTHTHTCIHMLGTLHTEI